MGRERALRGREFAAGELKKAQKGAKKRDPEQFRRAVEFLAEWTGGLCARSSRPRPTFDPEWPTKLKGRPYSSAFFHGAFVD